MPRAFNSFLKLRESKLCSYPLHLDPYGGGCFHNCTYCFQKDQLCFRNEKDERNKTRIPTAWNPDEPRVAPINRIKEEFEKVFDEYEKYNLEEIYDLVVSEDFDKPKFRRFCIFNRLPLRVGGVTDPFQKFETQHKVTYNLIKLLNKYDYPAQIVTKSYLVATNEYLNLLLEKPQNYYVQLTITTLDQKLSELLEPGAPSPKLRLDALRHLKNSNIYTAVRVNPLFPQEVYDRVNESYYSFIKKLKEAGVETVIVGGLRIMSKSDEYGPIASAEFIERALKNYDLFKGFDIKSVMELRKGTYYIPKEKLLKQYQDFKEACDYFDISFTVCHDSNDNARKSGFMNLWSNKSDCCNGYGNVPGFKITFEQLLKKIESNG